MKLAASTSGDAAVFACPAFVTSTVVELDGLLLVVVGRPEAVTSAKVVGAAVPVLLTTIWVMEELAWLEMRVVDTATVVGAGVVEVGVVVSTTVGSSLLLAAVGYCVAGASVETGALLSVVGV